MKIRCLVDTYGVNICRIRVPRPTDIFKEPLNPAYCYRALNFKPRSPWGERRSRESGLFTPNRISIHAPRGGSDQ